jgi:2-dehydropantoate 2-reductase
MRIAVMGSGGVGGYFGARLAQAGCDVTFVARGRQLEALRERGLPVESPRGELHLPQVRATERPSDPADCVLFGVKLWDTAAAAAAIRPIVTGDAMVVSLQNGVVKDDILREELGERAVVGGVCYIAATIAEPGVIRHSGAMQKIVVGEYDGSTSPRLQRLRDACVAAGVDVELSSQFRRTLWEKFVFLAALAGITAAARAPVGPIRSGARSRAFIHDTIEAAVQVARAEGVALPADYARDRMAFCDGLPATMTSSMHHDLERGHRLEVAWLSGDVVARGARLGVPTPCHRALYDILSVHADGRAPA